MHYEGEEIIYPCVGISRCRCPIGRCRFLPHRALLLSGHQEAVQTRHRFPVGVLLLPLSWPLTVPLRGFVRGFIVGVGGGWVATTKTH